MLFKDRSHSKVGYHDPGSYVSRQDIDRGSAPKKIIDHLGSDFRGVGADSFLRHAVVCSQRKDDFVGDPGSRISLDSGDLDREGFELPQGTLGFRKIVLSLRGL